MRIISGITDCGVCFYIEFHKDIPNCPLKLQQNDPYALEVHRITVAMGLRPANYTVAGV